jgi:hypothetical protein
VEEDGRVTLAIKLDRAGGRFGELWFVFPPDMRVASAQIDGRTRKVASDGVGVAHIGLTLDGPAEVVLRFERVE